MAVYLLHFSQAIGNPENTRGMAQHYLGSTKGRLSDRIQQHREGKGSKITAHLHRKGINFEVVDVWPGGYKLEAQLKSRKNGRQLCPICRANARRFYS